MTFRFSLLASRSCALIAFVALTLALPTSSAQNLTSVPCGPGINGTEIAVELELYEIASMAVYDRAGTLIQTTDNLSYPTIESRPGDCDAFVNFGGADGAIETIDYPGGIDQPLTIEFRYGSGQRYRILYGRGSLSAPCASSSPDGFFCPNVTTNGGDNQDFLAVINPSRVRISPTWMFGNGGDYVDEAIPGEDWVIPYHNEVICSDPDVTCMGGTPEQTVTNKQMFLMPVDNVLVWGAPLTKRLARSMTLPSNGVYDWTASWLTLAFAPGESLTIESEDFAATGMTFTASDPAQGWRGLRVTGGTATLAGQSAVEGAGATVLGGTLTLDGAFIDDAPGNGIYASGSLSQVYIQNGGAIRDSGSWGIFAENGADATLGSGAEIRRTGSAICSRGAGTTITFVDGAGSIQNTGNGTFSDYYGEVVFAPGGNPVDILRNGSGLRSETAGSVLTGSGGHRIIDNTQATYSYDVFGMDGSYTDADYNYWGPTVFSSNDLEIMDGDATIIIDPVLTTDPAGGAFAGASARSTAPPTGEATGAGGPFASALGTDTVQGWVEAAEQASAEGNGLAAVDAVEQAITSARTESERRIAWAAAARLAVRLQKDAGERTGYGAAWAQLAATAQRALSHPDEAPWALRVLALGATTSPEPRALDDARSYVSALLASAEGRAPEPPRGGLSVSLSHAAFAHLLQIRLALAEGDEAGALAALAALAAVDEAQASVAAIGVTATFPDANVTGTVAEAKQAARQAADVQADVSNATRVDALVVSPNPTAGPIRLTYAVAASAEVDLTVYDGLGRRVVVVSEGTHGAGAHTEAVDLGALPAGVYLARLTVRPADGTATVVEVRRFALVR